MIIVQHLTLQRQTIYIPGNLFIQNISLMYIWIRQFIERSNNMFFIFIILFSHFILYSIVLGLRVRACWGVIICDSFSCFHDMLTTIRKANQSIVVVGSLVLWQVSPIQFSKMMIYSTSTILSTDSFSWKRLQNQNAKTKALRGLVTHWMIYPSFKGEIKAHLNAEWSPKCGFIWKQTKRLSKT